MNWRIRFRLKYLWLVHACAFLWAHKPLCERFEKEVLRVGRFNLCRSCTCVYVGIGAGLSLGFLWPETAAALSRQILTFLVLPVLALSMPPFYKRIHRIGRDVLRFLLGFTLPWIGFALWYSHAFHAVVACLLLVTGWLAYKRKRAFSKLHECDGCPELGNQRVCSGFELQAERIRDYEQQATELVIRSGFVPKLPSRRP